jgi:hypothetical protein
MPSAENYDFVTTLRDLTGKKGFDSGTWSLNNRKSGEKFKITFEGYRDYLKYFHHHFDFYFNFDSNFTEEGFATNIDNQLRLEAEGLKPVPVVHDINGYEIDYYIERKYPMVALGSTQMTDLDSLMHVIDRFADTGIKLHLFGNASFEFLANAPIYSCDSTGWANKGKFGDVCYWNPEKSENNKIDKIHLQAFFNPRGDVNPVSYSRYKYKESVDRYLVDTFGLTYSDLIGLDGAYNKMLVNTHFYVQLENIINQIHRAKGFLKAQD